jgi:hypothetical protein
LDLAQLVRAELDLTLKKSKNKKSVGVREGLGHLNPLCFILFCFNIWPMRNFKKNQEFQKEKSKIRCLWTQLNFIEGLIEFIEGLITRKIDF